MERRTFIRNSVLGSGAVISGASINKSEVTGVSGTRFKLNYAPHLGMFRESAGQDPISQLNFMADEGFTAFEDNSMKSRPVELQQQMVSVMRDRGLKMGVFVGHKIYWDKPNLTCGDDALLAEFLNDIRTSVDVAKRVGAKWMTVVPGHVDLSIEMGYQTANVVKALRKACHILEPHELIMVLEPLNWWADHAGQFLTSIPQAYQVCKAVDSPSCKILFDIYHQQITEGNIIPNLDKAWDEVAYIQVGDNPGRNEPTTGEINYQNIFAHLYSKGYEGLIGMEHGNSIAGIEGENAVIKAYREVDSF
jgi:hydroxypyruvate isomerase